MINKILGAAVFLVLGAFLVFKWEKMPPPQLRRCDRVGACWIVDQVSKTDENNAGVQYLLETNYYGDRYLDFIFWTEQDSWLEKTVIIGQPIYEKNKLIYAPCNSNQTRDDRVMRACSDAIETAIQVDWYFVPFLMPSWAPPEYIKANLIVGWYRGLAVLRGRCSDCFYYFPVIPNQFREYSPGLSIDYYRSDRDKVQFEAFRKKALFDYHMQTQTLNKLGFK